ncbi:MAG: CRTAC1 family protein, partial [Phycisphaerales bacterium]
NNNADGTFTDIAASAGVGCQSEPSIMLAPADIDGDRDTDLVVFNQGPARVFFNDRLGKYHEERITTEPVRGDFGGVLQDFNGDGKVDLLVTPGLETPGQLYLADGTGTLVPSSQFDGCIEALATWGSHDRTRVADVDLDGDLDIAVFGQDGHVLLNDGRGRFVSKTRVWPRPSDDTATATELTDLTGDGVPDCLRICTKGNGRIELVETKLTPPANWLAVTPTGHRGADKRTRSPASGFGTRMELRCGLHSQMITYTGLNGGLTQSHRPLIFGLDGVTKADYLAFRWPDGVTQYENDLAAGTHHRISEMERRVSSCPVLFAWNGERFEFVSDFAGVGGLGYFAAPDKYASPQALEHVKIEPEQLAARNGFYELRICEPMEEVGYIDRLVLLAVDHPNRFRVYPDERLAISGPPPSHRLLCPSKPIFPVRATAPDGTDCTGQLTEVDRKYAYQPKLDRRFYGFCDPHTLVVDFADRLADLKVARQVYLFLNGWIEYPYSQTTFAAAQADVNWQPMKVEQETADGQWETIIPDAGAPGGMGRMITIDLTGKISPTNCRLRISTNLEIYYDQLFIAADRGTEGFVIRSIPMADANLRRLGFPLEYSPDGRHPYVYTYDSIQPTSSFKMLKGAYTRYGPVETLLAEFDDRYVILGTGDEIAVRFDARTLPPPGEGHTRSFILVSHAYCKDMDLYTATPDTVEPLPFRDMSAYPYPASEHYPNGDEFRYYHQRFNTRSME